MSDTVWAAFTNATEEEWAEYLDYRRFQGFDALQISVLPILKDESQSELGILPFSLKADGRFDYGKINHAYFDRAEKLLQMAVDRDFIPSLVLLWLDYVPDTWGSKRDPELVMPDEEIITYVEYAAKRFSKFEPIFLVSGDTNFESERTIKSYMLALETLKSAAPDSLTTLHLCGNHGLPPEDFVNSEKLNFYMYQSFHLIENQNWAYELAEQFMKSPITRPLVNGEPCYEGHGYGHKYGRFGAFDCRKAIWQSVLSGAKAGVTYGAHGVWSWHKKGKVFCSVAFSGEPYDWRTALRLKGAWDAVFVKWLMENFNLFNIIPMDKIKNDNKEIRLSGTKNLDKVVVYIPYNSEVTVDLDLRDYEFTLINLEEKLFAKPEVVFDGNMTILKPHDFNADVLLLAFKK